MKYRTPIVPLALLVIATLWFLYARDPKVAAHSTRTSPPNSVAAVQASPVSVAPETESSGETTEAPPSSTQSEAIVLRPKPAALAAMAELPEGPEAGPGLTPVTVLENMRTTFRQYSQRFGGNPVGINREITAALNGGNPGQAILVNPEDGLRINGRGELVDNWGTPFFFHQLSRTEMEIHSAGPDRKLWNSDDLVLK